MPKPEIHVFICNQTRPDGHPRGSCGASGAGQITQMFSEEVAKRNLFTQVAVTVTGCLGPCDCGPNVLVYPGSYLYIRVKPEDVNRIVEQHIMGGEPVQELLAPAELW
ncbi:(2Fe-2S) ferredoxin domain-containing protein [Amphritea pacifica]|uniref:(2Fe-2S) ferredoxin domain-containing protein n=1 Tax=Amphritea pacifica TaxID=2811233 RepID=A0ABS2W7A6_9GAMM|nr:(2Fe-2S) ferredoxin domain-containing protein [Amphritea pacifica]MBN0987584.1 (2Fe-2S) ferredoxin domain-containing protein [Amphritea pacifica]MBN1007429.1 (2Fe-2S) ferredoxin domain-containing protein [Amphritea pacifica]